MTMKRFAPFMQTKRIRAYYRLSNSNTIEIKACIEGGGIICDAFTHKILGKKTPLGPRSRAFFGERVTFYNWIQHYLPGPQEALGYDLWKTMPEKDVAVWCIGADIESRPRPRRIRCCTLSVSRSITVTCPSSVRSSSTR